MDQILDNYVFVFCKKYDSIIQVYTTTDTIKESILCYQCSNQTCPIKNCKHNGGGCLRIETYHNKERIDIDWYCKILYLKGLHYE